MLPVDLHSIGPLLLPPLRQGRASSPQTAELWEDSLTRWPSVEALKIEVPVFMRSQKTLHHPSCVWSQKLSDPVINLWLTSYWSIPPFKPRSKPVLFCSGRKHPSLSWTRFLKTCICSWSLLVEQRAVWLGKVALTSQSRSLVLASTGGNQS